MSVDASALHLDDLLVVVASILFFVQLFSLRWGIRLRAITPIGQPGAYLLRTLVTVAVVNVLVQALSVAAAVLIVMDPHGSVDVRIIIFLAVESLMAGSIIWSMWRLRVIPDEPGLPADLHVDDPSAQGS